MHSFLNNIYNNSHKIIGWDPNKSNKYVERLRVVTAGVSGVGTGGGRLLGGEVNKIQGMYSTIPIRL